MRAPAYAGSTTSHVDRAAQIAIGESEIAFAGLHIRLLENVVGEVKSTGRAPTPSTTEDLGLRLGHANRALVRASELRARLPKASRKRLRQLEAQFQRLEAEAHAIAQQPASPGSLSQVTATQPTSPSARVERGLNASRESDPPRAPTIDPIDQAFAATLVNESSITHPAIARKVVNIVADLSPAQRSELVQRLVRYRPGSGDVLAARLARVDVEVRRLVLKSLELGPMAGALLRWELDELERKTYGDDKAATLAVAFTPEGYIQRYEARLRYELARQVATADLPAPHPRLRWGTGPDALALALEQAIDQAARRRGGLSNALRGLLQPADAFSIVANYLDQRTHQAEPGGSAATAAWQSLIADALAIAMVSSIKGSLPRVGLRYAAQSEKSGGDVAPTSIVASAPIDRLLIDLLCTAGIVQLVHPKGQVRASEQAGAFANGLRLIQYAEALGERDPALWNWIKVGNPVDATREEVAKYVFHEPDSERAYGITAVPPYFCIPARWASGVPFLARHASKAVLHAATSTSLEDGARDGALALAASSVGSELAGARSTVSAPATSTEPLAEIVQVNRLQLGALAVLLHPHGLHEHVWPAKRWLERVADQPAPVVAHWEATLRAQRSILAQVSAGVRDGLKVERSNTAIESMIRDYAAAAGASHTPELASALLASADRRRAELPLTLLEQSAKAAHHARIELSGATRHELGANPDQDKQQDLERDVLALRRQGPASADPEAIAETAQEIKQRTLLFQLKLLQKQSRTLVRTLDGSNDGVIGWASNLGQNGDIAAFKQLFERLGAQAELIADDLTSGVFEAGRQVSDSGLGDNAAVRRQVTSVAVSAAAVRYVALAEQEGLRETITRAWSLADSAMRRSAIGRMVGEIALLVGISLAGSVAGSYAAGSVRGLLLADAAVGTAQFTRAALLARIAGTTAGIATDVTINAVGQTIVSGDSLGASFTENLISTVMMRAAMAPMNSLVAKVSGAENGLASLWKRGDRGQWLLAHTTLLTGEFLSMAGAGLVSAKLTRGEQPRNEDEALSWFVQGISMMAGKLIGSRLTELEQRAKMLGERGAHLRKRARSQRAFATKLAETTHGDGDAAMQVLADYHSLLQAEATLLHSPAVSLLGLDPAQLATLREGNASSRADKDLKADPIAALFLSGLRPSSADGVEWHGSIERIHMGLATVGARDVHESGSVVTATIAGEPRTFYIVDAGAGSTAHDRLTKIGAGVRPSNTDPSRRQWQVRLGDRSIEVHEAPRTTRLPDSKPARTPADLSRARKQAAADKAAFVAWQAHVQTQLEAQPFIRTRHLQKGLGPAGVLNQAHQPPELGGLRIDERLVVAAELATVLEVRGSQPLGQHRSAIDSPAIPVAEHSAADRPGEFVTSDELADAMARGRARMQANLMQGTMGRVEQRPATPGADWLDPSAPLRVTVRTPSGKEMSIYADRIDDVSGPGAPRDAPLKAIMDPAVLADGQLDGTIVAGADLELRAKLRPGANILAVPGSPTADWGAETAAYLGPTTKIDLVGDIAPPQRAHWDARLAQARESGDPDQIARVIAELEHAAHPGLQVPRNQGPGAAGDHPQINVQVGRPMRITRRTDGRYDVAMHAVVDDHVETKVYDQIIYAYGQDKATAMTEAFGPGAAAATGDLPAGSLAFEPVYHEGVYVGLKMVGSEYFLPGPAASPSLAPWVVASHRRQWLDEIGRIAAPGTTTRDHGPISNDSQGVHDGLETQRDRIGLANEKQAITSYRLPGTDIELHLGADRAAWRTQLEAFFRSQLPATPEGKIHVVELAGARSGSAVYAIDVAGKRLGVIKLYASADAAHTEAQLLSLLEAASLERMHVVRGRDQVALDAEVSGHERALLMDAAPGQDLRSMAEALPKDPIHREESMNQLQAAVKRVAEGLAELHIRFHDPSISKDAARATRQAEAEKLVAMLSDPATVDALGGPMRAARIEATLRDQAMPAFIAADLPATAFHGNADVGNFKVDGWDPATQTFAELWTYDVGMKRGFADGQDLRPDAQPLGDKPGEAMDSAHVIGSLDALVRAGTLTSSEVHELSTAFHKEYAVRMRGRGLEVDRAAWVDAERWYRAEREISAAQQGDRAAVDRIDAILGLEPVTMKAAP